MKQLLIWMLLSIACLSCSRYKGNLYRIYENNLYGYIDSIGNVIIKPQFKYASNFQDGVALVVSDVNEAFHIDTVNSSINFFDGVMTVDSLDKTTRKVHEGITVKYGYINTQGKIIIDTCQTVTLEQDNFCIRYSDLENFLAKFSKDSLEFETFILEELLPNNELFLYQDCNTKLWGYNNLEEKTYIEPIYKYAGVFSEGRAIVNIPDTTKNILQSGTFGAYGIIDTDGNIVVTPKYALIRPYENGGSWGTIFNLNDGLLSDELLDTNGHILMGPFISNNIFHYNLSDNGSILVEINTLGYKSYTYKKLGEDKYITDFNNDGLLNIFNESLEDAKSFNEGYAPVKSNGKWVFINDKCSILSEEYDSTGVFSEGYARVMFNGISNKQWGYIDTTFNLVIPYKFSECSDFHNGLAYFKNVNPDGITEGYINKQGTIIWSTAIKNDIK